MASSTLRGAHGYSPAPAKSSSASRTMPPMSSCRKWKRMSGLSRKKFAIGALFESSFVRIDEPRDHLDRVADDAVMRDVEDRRLGIGVDGDDVLRFLHAGPVLDGAGDADGDVQLGAHGDAGLAHLPLGRNEARIDSSAASRDFAADRFREVVQQ